MQVSEFADEYGDWLSGDGKSVSRARWLQRSLGEIPWEPPLLVSPNKRISEVIELMQRAKRSAVLVFENGEVLGIFTERDVLGRVIGSDNALLQPVSALMTCSPHVLTERTQLGAALRILALGSYHHLPVLGANKKPVGLVSLQTIVAYLVEQFPNEILNAPPDHDAFPPQEEGG